MFAELRQALEVQQVAIAERLEAVRQAEAALVHLHDVPRFSAESDGIGVCRAYVKVELGEKRVMP
jgi:hypothetical protein